MADGKKTENKAGESRRDASNRRRKKLGRPKRRKTQRTMEHHLSESIMRATGEKPARRSDQRRFS